MISRHYSIALLFITGLALCLFGWVRGMEFDLQDLSSADDQHPEWSIPPLGMDRKGEIDKILQKQFKFFDEGAQSYAFISHDGQYVLKIFKTKHSRPGNKRRLKHKVRMWLTPKKELEQIMEVNQKRWTRKLSVVCSSYHLAYQEMPEETALEFIHLQKTQGQFKPIILKDRVGRTYRVSLDDHNFILQKRVDLVPDRMRACLKRGDRQEIEKLVSSLDALLVQRAQKGITDSKQCYGINYGFYGTKAIQLDPGKIRKDVAIQSAPDQEIERVRNNLKKWIDTHYSSDLKR